MIARVHPLARAAIAVALIAGVSRFAELHAVEPPLSSGAGERNVGTESESPVGPPANVEPLCPRGTLPDQGVCIPVPADGDRSSETADARAWTLQNLIPLRPDRPREFERFEWPVPVTHSLPPALGAPPDAPVSDESPAARGVRIPLSGTTKIGVPALEAQTGSVRVLHIGALMGITVATLHSVRRSDQVREYAVLLANLGELDGHLKPQLALTNEATIGTSRESHDEGFLYVEVRQARHGVALGDLELEDLIADAQTVAVDPRNVFPIK